MNEDTRESPVETGWFWLSSRYYSPELCRFISPDDIEYLDPESVNGLNLYCYCANDPINHVDPSGHFTIAALIISFAVNVIFEIIDDVRDGELFIDESHDWKDYLGAGISGLFGGLTPIETVVDNAMLPIVFQKPFSFKSPEIAASENPPTNEKST